MTHFRLDSELNPGRPLVHVARRRVDVDDDTGGTQARRRRAEPDLAHDPRRSGRRRGAEHGERAAAERRAPRCREGTKVLRVAVADAVEFGACLGLGLSSGLGSGSVIGLGLGLGLKTSARTAPAECEGERLLRARQQAPCSIHHLDGHVGQVVARGADRVAIGRP